MNLGIECRIMRTQARDGRQKIAGDLEMILYPEGAKPSRKDLVSHPVFDRRFV
jgi:hypothetical protein